MTTLLDVILGRTPDNRHKHTWAQTLLLVRCELTNPAIHIKSSGVTDSTPQTDSATEVNTKASGKRRSPYLIALFAIVVFFVGRAVATEHSESSGNHAAKKAPAKKTVAQFNGKSVLIDAYDPTSRQAKATGRPVAASLTVTPGNFDADAAQDGWHAHLILVDAKQNIVNVPYHAKFELIAAASAPMFKRNKPVGRRSGSNDGSTVVLQTWHQDSDIASPVRMSDQAGVMWCPLVLSPAMQSGTGNYAPSDFGLAGESSSLPNVQQTIGKPPTQVSIKVRVSVAGHGTFDAIATVVAEHLI